MRTLAIDTSGRACSIALFDGEALLASRHELLGRGHAEAIIPWIAALPDGGRAEQILVGCGPGSFTGVRVGIAAAQGLGLGWNVPVYGMSSLALIAIQYESDSNILVAIEGGHGELFLQSFSSVGGAVCNDVQSMTPEVAALHFSERCVVGSAAERFVSARGWGEAVEADPKASLAFSLPAAMRSNDVRPLYGRGPDAKVSLA